MMRLVILGFGYCAQYFVAGHGAAFDAMAATCRSDETRVLLAARGMEALDIAHGLTETLAERLRAADAILVAAAPDGGSDPFVAFARAALAGGSHARIAYLSTVGVYGNHDGAWVDEGAELRPSSRRGKLRMEAEAAWQALGAETGAQVGILRLPGIYGPGRSQIDQLRAGTARRIDKPGQVFNRAHVVDIAGGIAAFFAANRAGIWNIVDDEPRAPQDVVAYAAGLIGVEPPALVSFEVADMTPMARSFYGENKRVSNARAKAELGWRLRYPTYREGLAAIAAL